MFQKPDMSNKFLLILHILVCAVEVNSLQLERTNYDYMVLTLQWPPSFCRGKECEIPVPHRWTIHGLWPSNEGNRNRHPRDCYTGSAREECFTNLEVPPALVDQMTTKWPNLTLNGDHHSFWTYEYCKHGTCAANVLPTIDNYFSKTMDLYDDVNRKLERNGINTPGPGYTFAQLDTALGKIGRYTCEHLDGKQYLKELGYCYNLYIHMSYIDGADAFNGRDCPARGNCDRKKEFYLFREEGHNEL